LQPPILLHVAQAKVGIKLMPGKANIILGHFDGFTKRLMVLLAVLSTVYTLRL
jgi:hypothetical protein